MRRHTPISSPREQRGDKIHLDWRMYFLEFCKSHGEPIEHNGVLIFRDGWGYSSTDYKGPEYPPPAELKTLDELVVRYWVLRRHTLRCKLVETQMHLQHYRELMESRSMPLQQVILSHNEDGTQRRDNKRVDLRGLEQKEGWLITDVAECDERLREIEEHYKQKTA